MQFELEYVEHTQDSPVKCMVVSIDYSSPHWHYDYEVIFLLSGEIILNTGSQSIEVPEGGVVLLNPCEIHSLTGTKHSNLCLILQFSPNIITEEYGHDRSFSFHFNTVSEHRIQPEITSQIKQSLANIGYAVQNKPDGYQFLIKSCLYKFISDLFRYTQYDISENEHAVKDPDMLDTFNRINQYIKSNFKSRIKIDALCSEVGMSRSSLYRLLRNAAGVSVKDLIEYYRIEFSKNLLMNTGKSISYIAATGGFDCDASFYRAFRKLLGVTPNSYRNANMPLPKTLGIQGYTTSAPLNTNKELKKYM